MTVQAIDTSKEEELGGNVFYRKLWLQSLTDSYQFRFEGVSPEDGQGSLIYARIHDLLGERIVSLPFSDYTTPDMSPEKLKETLEYLTSQNPDIPISIKLSESHFQGVPDNFKQGREMVYHLIPIQEELKLGSSFKRGIKKAQKSGIQVRVNDTQEAVENYFALHSKLRVDKFKSLPQPMSFFQNIYNNFFANGEGFCLEALSEDTVAASLLILKDVNTWVYKFGASHPQFLEERPNNLLFHTLIGMAKEEGVKQIDLGISGAGDEYEGLRRFKRSMGGVELGAQSYSYVPEKDLDPEKAELKKIFGQISKAIAQNDNVYDAANEAGNILYRFFT